jgi:ribosome biogenesis GTPase
MIQGIIVKLTGGLYTVQTNDALIELKARGLFRHEGVSPMVGDHVTIEDGMIATIEPRKNQLRRPSIANIDQVLLVFSGVEPDFSFRLFDRLLAHATDAHIPPVLIVTKTDLMDAASLQALQQQLTYYDTFLPVYYTSIVAPNQNILGLFPDKVSVVAGQSGVGKSTLINVLTGSTIETQAISHALGRGKHTTRHSELLPLLGGYVGDTPGFGTVDFMDWTKEQLRDSFRDFVTLGAQCKFRGCYHLQEPGCAVKEQDVLASRYDSYVLFQQEVDDLKRYVVKK